MHISVLKNALRVIHITIILYFHVQIEIPYRGKKSRGKFSLWKKLVTSEKLVTFPQLIFQIRHFSRTNF